MKLCKDCIHHSEIRVSFLQYEHVCDVEKLIDNVDGEILYRKCKRMRDEGMACGPEAKLFDTINTQAQ